MADSRALRHRQQSRDRKRAWSAARDRKLHRRHVATARRTRSRSAGRRSQNGDPAHEQETTADLFDLNHNSTVTKPIKQATT